MAQAPAMNPSQVVLDGKLHPELISDSDALSIWLKAVYERPDASPEEFLRMKTKIGSAGLGPADTAKLTDNILSFCQAWQSLKTRFSSISPKDLGTAEALARQKDLSSESDRLFQDTEHKIRLNLSPQGTSQLETHLLRVKQHMIIRQGPAMK